MRSFVAFVALLVVLAFAATEVKGFSPLPIAKVASSQKVSVPTTTALYVASDDPIELSEGGEAIVGVLGVMSALVTFASEFTFQTTGAGLPEGPFGIVGLIEGVSYLSVVAVAAFSIFTKVKTGSGLPKGPAGLLGAAEGLAYLSLVAGVVVLGLDVITEVKVGTSEFNTDKLC